MSDGLNGPFLLAMDLDGTACNSRARLGERTKEALERFRARGNIVCFATGRREVDMLSFGDDDRFADYLLLNTGGKLVRTSDRTVLFREAVDPEAARTLITHCLAEGLQLHVLDGMYWAVNRWNDGLTEYVEELGRAPVPYGSLSEVPWTHLEGFMVTADLVPVTRYIEREGLPLMCLASEPDCVDIMPAGVSKWEGIRRLAEMIGIPHRRIAAAGDYDNDLDMIRKAGIGIAVANALPHVREAADYVTPNDNDHDAAADIAEMLLAIQDES